jgi:hypothetical protein
MLTPAPTYDLRLLGEGAEPSNRCRSVLSHIFGPTWSWTAFLEGVRLPGRLSTWSVDRSGPWWTRPFMESLALIEQVYPIPKLS